MSESQRALADTSIFIGLEAQRFDRAAVANYEWGVSVVTLGELRLGVLHAKEPESASRRLSTYQLAQRFTPIGIDERVAESWALLVSRLRAAGRKVPINNSWIAATAITHGIPIVTQGGDYDSMPGLQVIKL
ncbi:type II toxin-antitoxin system VapC family toxin [Nocardia sp. NPDC058480]|uniref:type II toxin-antitoxin system VapC family toxin n=1 Tax=unclassified Nocardia TaxID=2637762 RepID=UPI00364A9908